jgi:hypothetical protein
MEPTCHNCNVFSPVDATRQTIAVARVIWIQYPFRPGDRHDSQAFPEAHQSCAYYRSASGGGRAGVAVGPPTIEEGLEIAQKGRTLARLPSDSRIFRGRICGCWLAMPEPASL